MKKKMDTKRKKIENFQRDKQQPENHVISWKRNMLLFFSIIIVLALIGIRSLNIRHNQTVYEYPEEVYYYGYEVADVFYTPDATNEHYLELDYSATKPLRVLHLYYAAAAEQDLKISVDFLNGENFVKSIPYVIPAGESYAKIYAGDCNADIIRVNSAQSFSFSGAAYEYIDAYDETEKIERTILIVTIVMLILAGVLSFVTKVDIFVENLIESIKQKFIYESNNIKKRMTTMGHLCIASVAGIILWGILRKILLGYDWTFYLDSILIGMMIGILLYLLVIYWKNKEMQFDKLFLYCGLIIGTVFAVVLPLRLNISWDDQIHYMNVVAGSRLSGGTVSLSEEDFYFSCFNQQLREYEENNKEAFKSIINDEVSMKVPMSNTVGSLSYKTIVYAPAALTLFLLRGLGISTTTCAIFGRMAGVWFYIFAIYFGMKHLKSGKMIMATVALVPGFLFLVTNYNYDYWLIALIAYAMAYLLGEYQQPEKKIEIKDIVKIFGAFLIALLAKPVYIPLLGLAAFLPKEKFKTVGFRRVYRGLFVAVCVIAVAGFSVLIFGGGLGLGDSRGAEGVNAGAQIQNIIHNPKFYFNTIFNFLNHYLSIDMLYDYWANKAYYSRELWLGQASFIWMIIVALVDRNYMISKKVGWSSKIFALPLAYISIWCVATALYVTFTPAGADTVDGCQGRYIFPVVMPLLLFLSQIRFIKVDYTEKIQRIIEMIAMSGVMILAARMVIYFG